jgi:DNA-binding response OmpR family regulator
MSSRYALSGAHVLIVEDDHVLAVTLASVLEHEGATISGVCGSHRTAMDVIAKRLPSLALLDVNIIGGTSFELAHWLGEHHVPFAFVTGEPLACIPTDLAHLGYLSKPASGLDVRALARRLWAAAAR